MVSPVTVSSPALVWTEPVTRALATTAATSRDAPVDKITVEFKGDAPRIMVFTGKPGGGEDQRFVIDAKSGQLLSQESYSDKPLLYRIHSGEFFGDGGLVFAMGWGLALSLIGVSGLVIYLRILLRGRTPRPTGIRKWFW